MEKFKTKVLPLSKIKANQQNPRVISESRLKKLINSLLVFPAMLSLRPIVIDDNNIILGGNMRQTALSRISQMTWDEVLAQLETLPEYNELPDGGAAVREYWEAFLNKPQAEVIYASELSESEKQQFIIKDNVSYGDWDYDELENWDAAKLSDWGVDVELPDFGTANEANLPPELQGQDLDAEELPKIVGKNETAMERIILVYPKDKEEVVAKMLHLETITKVVYNLNELPNQDEL